MEKNYQIPSHIQQRITAEQAFHYRIVPIEENGDGLICKTDHQVLENLLAELQIVLDTPILLEKSL